MYMHHIYIYIYIHITHVLAYTRPPLHRSPVSEERIYTYATNIHTPPPINVYSVYLK